LRRIFSPRLGTKAADALYFAWEGTKATVAHCFRVGGNGEKCPMFTIVGLKPRPQPSWRKIDIFARLRPLRLTEVEQDEERCLEAMLHWHDPIERLRALRRRGHTLVDDNPASG
jgi:hypothetical protein